MKKAVFLFLVVFVLCLSALAQPVPEKKWEFSTSASFSSMKNKWNDATVLNVALNLGYFVYKGLEIEPAFLLYSCDVTDQIGYLFLGNMAYNFRAARNVTPFVLAGIGVGQGFPYVFVGIEDTVTVLNFGGGIKYTVGNSVGLRLEYRFAHFMMEGDNYVNDHQIFLGISLFF